MADDSSRVMGVTIVKPIVYGSVAKYIKDRPHKNGHTHEWSVYVRPYKNEDIGIWVKKVQFKLHDSYDVPTRVVEKPPFEVCETGWGEFEFVIKIFFQDTNEKPIILHHALKLYEEGSFFEPSENPIQSEFYEEIIFQDPSIYMKYILYDTLSNEPEIAEQHLHYEDIKKETLTKIMSARKKVQEHTVMYNERLKKLREAINKYSDEICALQSQCCSSSLD